MMGIQIVVVDAFTDTPFRGNPAAVCVLDAAADAHWMQSVALEMNLSETAFLHRETEGYRLRWFTPTAEVDLCGHATLASAHVLWQDGHLPGDQTAVFQTVSGRLTATHSDGWITLDFPSTPAQPAEPPPGLMDALGGDPVSVHRSTFDYLVELPSEAALRALKPNLTRLADVDARGIIVTAPGDNYDLVSRFFAPAVGVPEDPVTGSAHCALAPFWAGKLDKHELSAFQASFRGGELRLLLSGDRVKISGQAVTTFRGRLCP